MDQTFIKSISEADIPSNCIFTETYYIKIVNNIQKANYELYILENDNYEKIELIAYRYKNELFSVDVYMTSDACPEYIKIDTVESTKNESLRKIYDDNDIPPSCRSYEICFYYNQLADYYKIGYTISYEIDGQMHQFTPNLNKIQHNEEFNITIYLLSSPSCSDIIKLEEYLSRFDVVCQNIDINIIPNKCKENGENIPEGKSSKPTSFYIVITMIAGSVLILIAIVIVIVVVIVKKRKSKQLNDINSNSLGSSLLSNGNFFNE